MKKIVLFISLSFLFISASSQRTVTWFYLGLKAGGGISSLYNSPSFEDVNVLYDYLSPSYFYGGSFGFVFGDNIGVTAEVSMNNLSQKYDVTAPSSTYNSIMQINTFDYGFLLTLQSLTGLYFNLGPKFSNFKKATYTFSNDVSNVVSDRTSKFSPTFNAFMVEAGFMPVRTDMLVVNIGLRATYAFSSIVSEAGYIIPADDKVEYYPSYLDETTNPLQVMLSVELKYFFGRYGRASCGKYRFMINN